MKRTLIALTLLSAFLLLVACGGDSTPQPTPEPLAPTAAPVATNAPPTPTLAAAAEGICAQGTLPDYFTDLVLAKSVNPQTFEPIDVTDVYEPTQDAFHAVATLKDVPSTLKMRAVWYLLRARGYLPNTKLDESTLNAEQGVGTRRLDFLLKSEAQTFPPGSYCVEVYTEGNLALSKTFTVSGSDAPSNANASVITQIVLAQDIDPNNFAPVNPASTFSAKAPFIYTTVRVKDAPTNTILKTRWYPPNQPPLDFDQNISASKWVEFHLIPPPEGFPTGEYKVEIYVNDVLADTKTFTVE